MKTCSVCQRCYEDSAAVCVENHGTLIAERAGTLEMIPNYRLDSLLERDAVGESYLATNTALDKSFVVKIIAQNLMIGAGEQSRQTLQREVQAAANLDHPNIVRVYESGSLDDGAFYIVTESVGDKTLQGLLRNTGALPESEAVKIARQTAEGLMAAHTAGIIHRAVSPANIILTRDSQDRLLVKLRNFDFGGIKQQSAAGEFAVNAKINTLRYLSPEQFGGTVADAQTDVYSLGIVLYEMLCGRSPFNAPTSAAIADRKINEQPLSQLRFDVRALLMHTIKESLQKRPAARLQMGNFARQLRHIAQLILPLGENLPVAPQVLMSNEPASNTPEFTKSLIEEQSPHEVIMLDNVDTSLTNEVAEQKNIEQIEETKTDEMLRLGELAPTFIMQNESDDNSVSAETISADNNDANFKSNQIIEENQIDEIPFEADAAQSNEITADEISSLGELAPVFIMKDEAEADLSAEKPILAESSEANIDSFESNQIIAKQEQVDEIPFESDVEQNDEIPINKMPPMGELAPVFFRKNQIDEIPFESEPIIAEREAVNAASTEPEVVIFPEEISENRRETAAPNFTNYPNETPPRFLQANRSAIAGAGLIAVLISVMLGALLYYRMQHPTVSEQTTAAVPPSMQTSSDKVNNSTDAPAINDKNDTAETTRTDAPETKNSAPVSIEKTPVTAAKRPDQKLSEETTATETAVKQNEPIQEQAARKKPSAANRKPRTELSSALDDWISATNSRNVEQQMNYYAPKLNSYYLTRNASQDTVRAEKNRIFAQADAVDIQTGKPDITVSPDGQKAVMRFRKKYAIKQGQQSRRGEVIQELQWVKADDGWRIVSERDVKVINR